MENNRKIRVGITHGDINGIGYEVILKTFSDPMMLELCMPIIYGSPKVAAYHRKAMDIQTNFSIINSVEDAQEDKLSVLNCTEDELKVELGKPTTEAGAAALSALERALQDYKAGLIDVLVTAPINKHTIQSESFHFPGHTEYIEERVGNNRKALMILLKDDFRVALVTGHIPVKDIASTITKELIMEKIAIFHRSLKQDFAIDNPRIAVFSLNPHAGDNGVIGKEESEVIIPAIQEMNAKRMQCFGPYPADGFMGSGNYDHFMVSWQCIMIRDWLRSRLWLWMKELILRRVCRLSVLRRLMEQPMILQDKDWLWKIPSVRPFIQRLMCSATA